MKVVPAPGRPRWRMPLAHHARTGARRRRARDRQASAKRLLAHLHEKLVLDWRRKAATTADVRTTILDVLDADLPADPYPPEVFDAKVQAVFDHIVTAYGDDGSQRLPRRGISPAREAQRPWLCSMNRTSVRSPQVWWSGSGWMPNSPP